MDGGRNDGGRSPVPATAVGTATGIIAGAGATSQQAGGLFAAAAAARPAGLAASAQGDASAAPAVGAEVGVGGGITIADLTSLIQAVVSQTVGQVQVEVSKDFAEL